MRFGNAGDGGGDSGGGGGGGPIAGAIETHIGWVSTAEWRYYIDEVFHRKQKAHSTNLKDPTKRGKHVINRSISEFFNRQHTHRR